MAYDSIFKADLFAGQNIIVTGGGSGIGRCTAHELAALGAHVLLVGRKADKLKTVAAEIAEDGGKADWAVCDIREEEAVTHLADLLQASMNPDGLALVMEADHFCMQWRGVKDADSKMINSVMRGSFLKNPNLRAEFLSLLRDRGG